ncbi:cysteine proteinase [Didymella exigua CBS 183.55]|uniref:ubiquitinyl hydrolase 1 n=1 Tax=Didymella exigua CBS 183.55 TaxID=1150837 RepID=A0A6A5RIA1_9PLEO|nr:cysteine proteinase [Didymella exigua CBS 183.55]KAF1926818.1 cysteine proteinase [Didymella exigua CBS 183.55]
MVVHFQRRGKPDARYSLRGNPPRAAIILHRTARQRAKDTAAARIACSWPITRVNKTSRGLDNRGNDCFRNSALQALMHGPRFLNWILSHNSRLKDGTRQFRCQKPLATQSRIERAAMSKDYVPVRGAKSLSNCPACAMKNLVEVYWGKHQMESDDEPRSLNSRTPPFLPLIQVDALLSRFTPQAGMDGQQQDPEEFQSRFLQACLESVDYDLPQNLDWRRQFDALFDIDINLALRCQCGAPRPPAPHAASDEGGMDGLRGLDVLPSGQTDSVKASLRRKFTPENIGALKCATCNHRRQVIKTLKIEAAPELLRLKLSVVNSDGSPNHNVISINKHLDLTEHLMPQPGHVAPLKYRLSSVLYHGGGSNSGGHWHASVHGPKYAYEVNDDQVVKLTPKKLSWENSHQQMRAVVLMYCRVHQKAP